MNILRIVRDEKVAGGLHEGNYHPETRFHEYNGKLHGLRIDLYSSGKPFIILNYNFGTKVGYITTGRRQAIYKSNQIFGEHITLENNIQYAPTYNTED